MENNKKNLCIIYHFPCFDGSMGAINTFLYYKNFKNDVYNINFFPNKNTDSRFDYFLTEKKNYDKMIIIDLDLKNNDFEYLLKEENKNIKVLLFDHHKNWIEKYENEYKNKLNSKNIKIFLDKENKKSGCGLTFEYFKNKALKKFPENEVENIFSEKLKNLNIYIQDSDTGNELLKDIQEFKSGLCHELHPLEKIADFSYNKLYNINKFLNLDLKFLIRSGERLFKKFKSKSKNELLINKNIYLVNLMNNEEFLVCITKNKQYRNISCQILGEISKNLGYKPIGGFIYYLEGDLYKFSMRTSKKDSYDCSKIAEFYGGGGHENASSFTMNFSDIKKLLIKKIEIYKYINQIKI